MAFNFLSLITRFASVQFPSCSTDLGMQCAYDSYLVFDVKHGGIVGCDDNVVYAAEYHCIPLVFLICIACVIIKYATRRAASSVNWPLMF